MTWLHLRGRWRFSALTRAGNKVRQLSTDGVGRVTSSDHQYHHDNDNGPMPGVLSILTARRRPP